MKKRKDGRYAAQIFLGVEDGKKKYITVYGATQKEVKEKISEIKIKQGKGIDISAKNLMFGVWATRFLKGKKSEQLAEPYIRALIGCCKNLSPLNSSPLSSITTHDIQDLINKLASYHDGKKPLSKSTLTLNKQVVCKIYELAIISRVVEYNPAQYVIIPKNSKKETRNPLTAEQQQWIVDTPHRAQIAAMLMLYSGLRRGEATALTWHDINFKDNSITVNKAAKFINNKPQIKTPKTNAGNRIVKISKFLTDFLCNEYKKSSHIYILHKQNGEMLTESAWNRLWESYMHDLNIKYGYSGSESKYNPRKLKLLIEPFTIHQLRHTFATILYFSGVSPLVAKRQLGHESITVTMDIYTHLDEKHENSEMEKVNEYILENRIGNSR